MQYQDISRLIFLLDPEFAHHILENSSKYIINNIDSLQRVIERIYKVEDKSLVQHTLGSTFANPVGIGAGFDKNATLIPLLASLGFGYVEYGTLTPLPQEGNPKPRLFRYPKQNSIQNAMGFNNDGLELIKERVKELYPYKIPIGANVGKNKITAQSEAIKDYEKLIVSLESISDYIVINLSSPNTPGLRDLQNKKFIKELFSMAKSKTSKPVLLKIAPDLESKDAINLCEKALESGANGIIATNTTIDYTLLEDAKDFGGLSGEVLKEKSYNLFKSIAQEFYKDTTLISVGGIDSADEAYRRIRAGATLIQIFSALIFKGPSLAKEINQGLVDLLKKDGYTHISEAIGADLR